MHITIFPAFLTILWLLKKITIKLYSFSNPIIETFVAAAAGQLSFHHFIIIIQKDECIMVQSLIFGEYLLSMIQ